MECSGCGAPIETTKAICPYCGTPLKAAEDVTTEVKKRIATVVNSMEEVLQAGKGLSIMQGAVFGVNSALSIGSYFLYSHLLTDSTAIWILTGFTTFVFFLLFGFYIQYSEQKLATKIYNEDVLHRINDYLKTMQLHRYTFDEIADKELKKDAILRSFLYKN